MEVVSRSRVWAGIRTKATDAVRVSVVSISLAIADGTRAMIHRMYRIILFIFRDLSVSALDSQLP